MKKYLTPTVGLFIGCALASILFHLTFPYLNVLTTPITYVGVLLILIGIILDSWASKLFNQASTPVQPGKTPLSLVTTGPYEYSRNPMYIGMTLMLIGLSVFLGSLTAFIPAVAFVLVANFWFVPMEEQVLNEEFSEEYSEYTSRVRRWL